MRKSIATVSLGGSLAEKLTAIAEAGFEGVEIFEADVLAHDGAPADIGRMVRDHGLQIVAFQPFRDFEGMPEPQRARGFERARRKFALMNELGAETVLVCSNVSPISLGGTERAADDLRELGELAADFGIAIGYEALAWGRHVADYRDAWEIVRKSDHERVGIILDSWHVLALGLPVEAIRAIPADRIAFIQIADAPLMNMDLLQWSRHFRSFPGQGGLAIDCFMDAVCATGYDGWVSHEIFNDRFRMASPLRIARDGARSLLWLKDRLKPGDMPPRVVPQAVEWIEFAVSEADAPDLADLFGRMGFAQTGQHRSRQVTRYSQGQINLVINTEPDGLAHSHQIVHGPSVVGIGLRVEDAEAAMRRARALQMRTFSQPVAEGELAIPAIRALSGSVIHFTDRCSDLAHVWEVEFEPTGITPGRWLTRIDHIAESMAPGEILSWRLFYLSLIDVESTPQVDVVDPAGIVESHVLQDEDRCLRICLNTSNSSQTLSSRFLSDYFGAGVQHLAFATSDIFGAAEAMHASGLELLPIPGNYFDDIEARFALEPCLLEKMRRLGILYDEDEHGRYFQLYTRAFRDLFFFEIVQRDGYAGFGAPNAPIRLAAQSRFLRPTAIGHSGRRAREAPVLPRPCGCGREGRDETRALPKV
jgi:4-hydroxyphenylpyruvate dioxygenase